MEKKVKELYDSIKIEYKLTFISAFVCGLFAHLYQFTNKIPNYDEYGQTPAGLGATLSLGRWGLELAAKIYGFFFGWFSFPMVNGVNTLIFISLAACFIVASFRIRDKVICVLTGGMCTVFPVVVSTYFFMFTAPYYGLSLLLVSIAAFLCIDRTKEGSRGRRTLRIVVSILLACLATGIYQAYIAVYISMLLIDVIVTAFRDKEDPKAMIIRAVKYCACIVISLILYYVIMKTVNAAAGVEAGSYRGMDNMHLSVGGLIYGILSCYRAFFSLPTGADVMAVNYSTAIKIIYAIMMIMIFLPSLLNLANKKKALLTRLIMILGTMMLPAALFFVFIISQFGDGTVYTLMIYASVFIFIYPLILCDNLEVDEETVFRKRICGLISNVTAIASGLCIILFFWYDNANYQGLQYTHYHDMAYFQTLMTQVKSLEGYREDMPVAILGEFDDDTNRAGSLMEYHFHLGGKWETNINYKNRVMLWFCYLGFTPEVIEDRDSLLEISQKPEVAGMPTYPDAGSIAIVDDTVVIKANESIESPALY